MYTKSDQLKDTIKEMDALLKACKPGFEQVEALGIKDEFKKILKENRVLDGVDTHMVSGLSRFMYGCWLFEYKGRGFVLNDLGNGNFGYNTTAEECVLELGNIRCNKMSRYIK